MKVTKQVKLDTIRPFYNITQCYSVQSIVNKHKGFFFSKDTMRFFSSRLVSDVFPSNNGKVYFITSDKAGFSNPTREFNVREYDLHSDDMSKLGVFDTKAQALSYALNLAYTNIK